jgi:hypothetical protein
MVFTGAVGDKYTVDFGCLTSNVSYEVTNSNGTDPDFYETVVPGFSTTTTASEITCISLSTDNLNTSNFTLYSFALGFN